MPAMGTVLVSAVTVMISELGTENFRKENKRCQIPDKGQQNGQKEISVKPCTAGKNMLYCCQYNHS